MQNNRNRTDKKIWQPNRTYASSFLKSRWLCRDFISLSIGSKLFSCKKIDCFSSEWQHQSHDFNAVSHDLNAIFERVTWSKCNVEVATFMKTAVQCTGRKRIRSHWILEFVLYIDSSVLVTYTFSWKWKMSSNCPRGETWSEAKNHNTSLNKH